MEKLLTLILAVMFLFCMTGCSSNDDISETYNSDVLIGTWEGDYMTNSKGTDIPLDIMNSAASITFESDGTYSASIEGEGSTTGEWTMINNSQILLNESTGYVWSANLSGNELKVDYSEMSNDNDFFIVYKK